MTVVKLAEHECSSCCNTDQWNGFVSDASVLQTEDVYEGISSPQCISFTRNGLLKPQKFTGIDTITGKLAGESNVPSDLFSSVLCPLWHGDAVGRALD